MPGGGIALFNASAAAAGGDGVRSDDVRDAAGAKKILETGQTKDAKSVQLGDAALAYEQSVIFRKGPYLVRIVAYTATPNGPQALQALAQGALGQPLQHGLH